MKIIHKLTLLFKCNVIWTSVNFCNLTMLKEKKQKIIPSIWTLLHHWQKKKMYKIHMLHKKKNKIQNLLSLLIAWKFLRKKKQKKGSFVFWLSFFVSYIFVTKNVLNFTDLNSLVECTTTLKHTHLNLWIATGGTYS